MAIVTGGAMGIGFGIVRRFVESGANVLLVDLEGMAAEEALERLPAGPGRAEALELGPHRIRVNAIAPGGTSTEGGERVLRSMVTAEQVTAFRESSARKTPLRRLELPDDIAKVAVFLASSASDYMTGSTLVVDGGRLLV